MSEESITPPTEKLMVRVLAPTHRIYEGSAVSVSGSNQVGPFDVLAGHANFFSLLSAADITINTGTQTLTFPLNQGLIKVKNNEVTLFADIELNQLA